MSEITFASSDPAESRRISRQVKAGEFRELLPRGAEWGQALGFGAGDDETGLEILPTCCEIALQVRFRTASASPKIESTSSNGRGSSKNICRIAS
jgi:hypothetical protein